MKICITSEQFKLTHKSHVSSFTTMSKADQGYLNPPSPDDIPTHTALCNTCLHKKHWVTQGFSPLIRHMELFIFFREWLKKHLLDLLSC